MMAGQYRAFIAKVHWTADRGAALGAAVTQV
jgi:hypothetical protein